MQVTVAKSAGFCFGVKRAVDMVYDIIDKENGPIYTYGPIIHNDTVVAEMAEKGVSVMEEDGDKQYAPGTVILRSHGVSKEVVDRLCEQGHKVVDATCPFVKKIHNIVREHSAAGEYIVIVGNPVHPEVVGITGWIEGDDYKVISSHEEALAFTNSSDKPVCVVSQTTFNHNKFDEIVEIISKKGYHINVLNTICDATHTRQTEAARIAAEVDAMVVIGDEKSSNSQKLFEICKKECNNTYFVGSLRDLDVSLLQSVSHVGITAGASTPNKLIEEVQNNVRNEF